MQTHLGRLQPTCALVVLLLHKLNQNELAPYPETPCFGHANCYDGRFTRPSMLRRYKGFGDWSPNWAQPHHQTRTKDLHNSVMATSYWNNQKITAPSFGNLVVILLPDNCSNTSGKRRCAPALQHLWQAQVRPPRPGIHSLPCFVLRPYL